MSEQNEVVTAINAARASGVPMVEIQRRAKVARSTLYCLMAGNDSLDSTRRRVVDAANSLRDEAEATGRWIK